MLKFKLGLILFSFAVLTLIPLFKTNFNAPITIKKWQQLSWDDFQGFVKPFSKWGAVISSTVYLEFDSASQKYVAYAGQNNQYSWTTASAEDSASSPYMLNHEQYHFNITELHARMMNKYLAQNQDKSEEEYLEQLTTIRTALNKMQDKYDNETDHSLIKHRQRRWEYQIDSLLNVYSGEPNKITDYYSGATTFFPVHPAFRNSMLDNTSSYRTYFLKKYGMSLSMESYQYQSIQSKGLAEELYELHEKDSVEIKLFKKDSSKYELETMFVINDTSNQYTTHSLWIYHQNYLYRISAAHSSSEEVSGYEEIVSSFLSSFEIINTDEEWKSRLKNSNASAVVSSVVKEKLKGEEEESLQCATTSGREKSKGFFRGPMFKENGNLVLAYDITEHEDSLLYEKVLIIEDDWYTYQPDSVDHIFFVPADRIPDRPFRLKFGYFLAEDTVKECFEFHYQSLQVDPHDSRNGIGDLYP